MTLSSTVKSYKGTIAPVTKMQRVQFQSRGQFDSSLLTNLMMMQFLNEIC